jgi:hypothetical protein
MIALGSIARSQVEPIAEQLAAGGSFLFRNVGGARG